MGQPQFPGYCCQCRLRHGKLFPAVAMDAQGCGTIESPPLTLDILEGIEAGSTLGSASGSGNDIGFCFGSDVTVTSTPPLTNAGYDVLWNVQDESGNVIPLQQNSALEITIESLSTAAAGERNLHNR